MCLAIPGQIIEIVDEGNRLAKVAELAVGALPGEALGWLGTATLGNALG